MSANSKPSTGRHAELSKISETSSRALMPPNLTSGPNGSAAEPVRGVLDRAAHRAEGVRGKQWRDLRQVLAEAGIRLGLGHGLGLGLGHGLGHGLRSGPRLGRQLPGSRAAVVFAGPRARTAAPVR